MKYQRVYSAVLLFAKYGSGEPYENKNKTKKKEYPVPIARSRVFSLSVKR
jgi:hypothetical protein